jgi:hypothetical protein
MNMITPSDSKIKIPWNFASTSPQVCTIQCSLLQSLSYKLDNALAERLGWLLSAEVCRSYLSCFILLS